MVDPKPAIPSELMGEVALAVIPVRIVTSNASGFWAVTSVRRSVPHECPIPTMVENQGRCYPFYHFEGYWRFQWFERFHKQLGRQECHRGEQIFQFPIGHTTTWLQHRSDHHSVSLHSVSDYSLASFCTAAASANELADEPLRKHQITFIWLIHKRALDSLGLNVPVRTSGDKSMNYHEHTLWSPRFG